MAELLIGWKKFVGNIYSNSLGRLGVEGFRFDAIKHIEPTAIRQILSRIVGFEKQHLFCEIVTSQVTAHQNFAAYLPLEAIKFYNLPLLQAVASVVNRKSPIADLLIRIQNELQRIGISTAFSARERGSQALSEAHLGGALG
jgi:hypothetical protein